MPVIRMGPDARERRQLENPYLVREFDAANEEVKQPQRDRVAEFFAARQPADPAVPRRCFCLPGVRWAFEHTLDKACPGFTFVGVERNYSVLEASLDDMPGRHRLYQDKTIRRTGQKFRWYETDRARVVWSSASDFMTVWSSDFGGSYAWSRWRRVTRLWTCAWLDFSAPIDEEVVNCWRRLPAHLRPGLVGHPIPVAITFMIGREPAEVGEYVRALGDPDNSLTGRVNLLRAMAASAVKDQWECEPAGSWTYRSAGGAPMGVAQFLFRWTGRRDGRRDSRLSTGDQNTSAFSTFR